MKNFLQIASGIDVVPLLVALQLNPQLWNEHSQRIKRENSPHREASDIWVRYNDINNYDESNPQAFGRVHYPVWYHAIERLPHIRPLAHALMTRLMAVHLGGILITRIQPNSKIFPHIDQGWHPDFYNCKVHIPLQTNDECISYVENESVCMQAGDVWRMENTVPHEVVNKGKTERITLIICMRVE